MSEVKIVAYHCSRCGGNVDIHKKICSYCGNDNEHYRVARYEDRQIRVFVELQDGNKFYMPHITNIRFDRHNEFDVYRDASGCLHRVVMPSTHELTLKCYVTSDLIDKHSAMRKSEIVRVTIENLEDNKVFTFGSYVSAFDICGFECNSLLEAEMTFISTTDYTYKDIEIPEGLTCPNCAAEIKSKLGVCDCCGGWVEVLT